MKALGYLGSAMLAVCGVPLMLDVITTGHANGLGWDFLGLWLGGEVLTLAYVISRKEWPLILNYGFNIICLIIIVGYKL